MSQPRKYTDPTPISDTLGDIEQMQRWLREKTGRTMDDWAEEYARRRRRGEIQNKLRNDSILWFGRMMEWVSTYGLYADDDFIAVLVGVDELAMNDPFLSSDAAQKPCPVTGRSAPRRVMRFRLNPDKYPLT